MKIFIISDPLSIPKEHELINALMETGLEYFHLRKPEFTEGEMVEFLKLIQPKFLKRISIHSHYRLIEKYNLRGIHLTNKYLDDITEEELKGLFKMASKKNLQISTSVHHLEEPITLKYNYVFLSPVFDSISKEGYKSNFDPQNIKEYLKELKMNSNHPEIIALGGIEENKIEKIIDLGFEGLALMGTIWNDFKASKDIEKAIGVYNSIKLKCQTAGHTY
jgi:thiamine-phosphate pyrophosphorylase